MRVLRHGLEVTEMAVSELPGNPNAVWTVKIRADGELRAKESIRAIEVIVYSAAGRCLNEASSPKSVSSIFSRHYSGDESTTLHHSFNCSYFQGCQLSAWSFSDSFNCS
jgi:hypothetical protein